MDADMKLPLALIPVGVAALSERDMPCSAWRALVILQEHGGTRQGGIAITPEELATYLDRSVSTAKRALAQLVKHALVTRERRGRVNFYRVVTVWPRVMAQGA